jgi:starch synthase (maltosyl-transferring)
VSDRKQLPHIDITHLWPRTGAGAPTKAVVCRPVEAGGQLVKDGHDILGAQLRWRRKGGGDWSTAPLRDVGDDRWSATFVPLAVGRHQLEVVAWTDRFASWRRDVVKRADAGQPLATHFEVGARLLDHLADRADDGARGRLKEAAEALRFETCSDEVRLAGAIDTEVERLAAGIVPDWDLTRSERWEIWVDRERAGFSAWYELFPRSYGGFQGVVDELPRIAAMGFDIVYLPPVHPIGRTHRKGPNNTLQAGPADVGSPWAIGAAEGGHNELHPELGTEADLVALIEAARAHGMEIALDYALQVSPDHPWVAAHPEWFHQLPDGTIQYAENPPKKYQDIYPINFWPARERDRKALWNACFEILERWIAVGVRAFRVDNPHTKPLPFWEWLIERAQHDHPDVVFLAEAFTAPAMMARLAEVGFTQSYTYFTWRHSRYELTEYVSQLTRAPLVDVMRPNFWPNTPDILEGVLRDGPLSAFALRAVLAATLVPNYGIYSGYELGENHPASPDNTEYLNSEKYQIVHRDFGRQPNIIPLLTRLNDARRRHPGLQQMTGTRFHGADNDNVIVYSRSCELTHDVVLCAVNLDPSAPQAATLTLDLGALGLDWDAPYRATDELTGDSYAWQGPHPWVRLDPAERPAHVLHLQAR